MKFLTVMLFSTLVAAPVFANETYNTEVVKQNDNEWKIQRVMAYSRQEGTHVSGRMTAVMRFGLPRGHIDVAAYAPSGELLAETTTDYTPSILTHKKKQKGGVRFTANLTDKLPSNSTVKVAFHSNESSPSSGPEHSVNIAR